MIVASIRFLFLLVLSANSSCPVDAFQNQTISLPQVEVIVSGLDYPCAVTLHPELRWPIVANSGAGSIVAVVDGRIHVLIKGFNVATFDQDPHGTFGPTSLTTIRTNRDKHLLVVGTAGEEPGADHVSTFTFDGNDAISLDKSLGAEAELFGRTLNKSGEHPALGDFFGIASFDEFVWFTTRGDNSTSWIGEFQMTGGAAGKCRRFFKTASHEDESRSTAIAFGPDGMLAVATRQLAESPGSVRLHFFEIENGKNRSSFELDLDEIVAIAWSPLSGGLFVLNSSTTYPEKSGLYQLVASNLNRECRAVFLVNIANPAGMCFRDDGNLWVTSLGERPAVGNGALLLISQFDPQAGANDRPKD